MSDDVPPLTERAARQAHYRRLLVDAAEAEFAARGFEATRVHDVAKRAGVALGTLYGHVAGKAELMAAIHEDRLSALVALADEAPMVDTAGEALLTGLDTFIRWALEHPHYLRIAQQEGMGWASPMPFATGGDQTSAWRAGIGLLEMLVAEAMAEASMRAADAGQATRLIVSALQVFVTDAVTSGADAADVVAAVHGHVRRAFFDPSWS